MKTIDQQAKIVARICLGVGMVAIAASVLSGCSMHMTDGQDGKPGAKGDPGDTGAEGPKGNSGNTGPQGNDGSNGVAGVNGTNGSQGYGAGIKVSSAGLACSNGGIQVENYQDLNNNGQMDLDDPLISLSYVCNGTNGQNGQDGLNGQDGQNGADGSDGVAGVDGLNGNDGLSSTFSVVADVGHCLNGGFDVTLNDSVHSETSYVCNGTNGSNGQAGTNGTNGSNGGTVSFSLVQAINPCGANSSPWKEVILGLPGGQLISSFSETASGQNTRFAFIPNGSYQDTDSSGCHFSVTGDGSTVSEISWNAGSNQYATWLDGGYHWTQALGWVSL